MQARAAHGQQKAGITCSCFQAHKQDPLFLMPALQGSEANGHGKGLLSKSIPWHSHQIGKATPSRTVCVCAETSSQSREGEDIESTMDQIFGGILRSDVVCATCGYTSTAHDPFKDISVDIPEGPRHTPQPPAVDTPKPNPVKGSGKASKGNGKGSNGKSQPLQMHSAALCCNCTVTSRLSPLKHDVFIFKYDMVHNTNKLSPVKGRTMMSSTKGSRALGKYTKALLYYGMLHSALHLTWLYR